MKRLIFCMLLVSNFLYAQPKRSMGLKMDDQAKTQYSRVKKAPLLTKAGNTGVKVAKFVNLREYCPPVQDQGMMGTCTAWATGYYTHTILDAVQNQRKNPSAAEAYSAMWIYEQIKDDGDEDCSNGSRIDHAFYLLQNQGNAKYNKVPYECGTDITQEQKTHAAQYKIKEFQRVFDHNEDDGASKILKTRTSLMNKRPVAIGWGVTESFGNIVGDTWINPNETVLNIQGYHAMAVIGYDDSKNGGSFLLVNSWGTGWGDKGFAWVKYTDFEDFAFYGFEAVPMTAAPNPQPTKVTLGLKASFELLGGTAMGVKRVVPPTGIDIGNNIKSSSFTNYVFDKAYTSGTQFQFSCDVKKESYVYVLASDYDNVVNRAFPVDNTFSALIPYGNSQFIFPSPEHYLYLDNNSGKEFICFLVSHKEVDFDKLTDDIKKQGSGEFFEKVKAALGNRFLEQSGISYKEGIIDFELELEESSDKVAMIVVELNHQ